LLPRTVASLWRFDSPRIRFAEDLICIPCFTNLRTRTLIDKSTDTPEKGHRQIHQQVPNRAPRGIRYAFRCSLLVIGSDPVLKLIQISDVDDISYVSSLCALFANQNTSGMSRSTVLVQYWETGCLLLPKYGIGADANRSG